MEFVSSNTNENELKLQDKIVHWETRAAGWAKMR